MLTGSHMTLGSDPPAAQLQEVATERKSQFTQVPSGGYRWLPLNTTIKPLDNINVRKAIIAAFDREAIRKVRGGRFIGDVATHFLRRASPASSRRAGSRARATTSSRTRAATWRSPRST